LLLYTYTYQTIQVQPKIHFRSLWDTVPKTNYVCLVIRVSGHISVTLQYQKRSELYYLQMCNSIEYDHKWSIAPITNPIIQHNSTACSRTHLSKRSWLWTAETSFMLFNCSYTLVSLYDYNAILITKYPLRVKVEADLWSIDIELI